MPFGHLPTDISPLGHLPTGTLTHLKQVTIRLDKIKSSNVIWISNFSIMNITTFDNSIPCSGIFIFKSHEPKNLKSLIRI